MVRSGETLRLLDGELALDDETSATVWSVVICEDCRADEVRARIAKCATNASGPATSTTSSVVPMPCLSGSF